MSAAVPEPAVFTLSRGSYGLGFNITGGTDQPHLPNDDGIFVTKIRDSASAAVDGRLKEGDKILRVNGQTLINLTHKEAVEIFLGAGETVELQVWHGAERYLINDYSMKLQSKSSPNGFKKLMILAGFILLGSITLYYAKKRTA